MESHSTLLSSDFFPFKYIQNRKTLDKHNPCSVSYSILNLLLVFQLQSRPMSPLPPLYKLIHLLQRKAIHLQRRIYGNVLSNMHRHSASKCKSLSQWYTLYRCSPCMCLCMHFICGALSFFKQVQRTLTHL